MRSSGRAVPLASDGHCVSLCPVAQVSFILAVTAVGLGLFGALRCIAGEPYVGFAALGLSACVLRMTPGLWSPIDEKPAGARDNRLALLAIALGQRQLGDGRVGPAAWLLLIGIVLFSGCLYVYALLAKISVSMR